MPIYQIIIPMQHITSVFQCWLKVNCLEFIKLSSEAIMYTFIYIPYILQRLSYTSPLEICRNDSAVPAKTCTCALMAQGISLINFNRTIQSINLNICMNLCNKKVWKRSILRLNSVWVKNSQGAWRYQEASPKVVCDCLWIFRDVT